MKNRRSGFTLVELLVAMAVFAVVISIATGAFIRALRTQRQLVSFAAANSNISLVLEQIAREMRVGSEFRQDARTNLSFTNGKGEVVTYSYDETNETIFRTIGTGTPQQLTSDNVAIKQLEFLLQSAAPDDGYPARVTITVGVSPKEVGVNSSIVRIQTTVSARNIGT